MDILVTKNNHCHLSHLNSRSHSRNISKQTLRIHNNSINFILIIEKKPK